MQVSSFHHPPSVILVNQKDHQWDGLEVRLLTTLASALNFEFQIEKPKDGEKWGRKISKDYYSGTNTTFFFLAVRAFSQKFGVAQHTA